MKKYENAIWIGKSLFERGRATGSSANMSFIHEEKIYITGTGTCFGRLAVEDFAVIDSRGNHVSGARPSKELPLHQILYKKDEGIKAVLHTHSFYSTIWSCLDHENTNDVIPEYTPYLKMKLGKVGLIPYAKPGTRELFDSFRENIGESNGYLLKNHGVILGQKDLMSSFYTLEELEDSAQIAWGLRNENQPKISELK